MNVLFCSGGVGRTGVYCAISILIERVKAEGVIDVFQTVQLLRLQRPAMVQILVSKEHIDDVHSSIVFSNTCFYLFFYFLFILLFVYSLIFFSFARACLFTSLFALLCIGFFLFISIPSAFYYHYFSFLLFLSEPFCQVFAFVCFICISFNCLFYIILFRCLFVIFMVICLDSFSCYLF